MIKAVIFDVDGVLLDSVDQIVDAYQEVGRRLKLKVPRKDFFRKRLGIPYYSVIEEAYGKNIQAKELFKKVELEMDLPLMSNVGKILEKIKLPKAIVTTKPKSSINKYLKEILHHFSVIVALEDTEKHKPNPEPLLLACKKLGIHCEETVYVGDMVRDYETAKNASMKFVGVLGGASTENEFRKAKVRYLIKSLEELPEILKKMECDKILLLKKSFDM